MSKNKGRRASNIAPIPNQNEMNKRGSDVIPTRFKPYTIITISPASKIDAVRFLKKFGSKLVTKLG